MTPAQPPAYAGWSHWPQHHPNGEYYEAMMNPGMMPYDSRPTITAPFQRLLATCSPAPAYVEGPPPVMYGGYTSFATSPVLGSPFKRDQYSEWFEGGRGIRDPSESLSPSIKSEPRAMPVASRHSTSPTTVSSSLPPAGVQEVVFNNKVDALMKAIQSKSNADLAQEKIKAEPEHVVQTRDPKADMLSQGPPPSVLLQQQHLPRTQREPLPSRTQSRSSKPEATIYTCNFPNCSKSFLQKTHFKSHTRSHTGEKPYVCSHGCGERFSQPGNRKSHERRHTGEKPYKCTICNKSFTQGGTLKAHVISHSKIKPFPCKLDDCNKNFTLRGNLKSHQNKFHSATLEALTKKFATIEPSKVPNEDKELWEYFKDLYRNSNKGIKGRGKHRKVKVLPQLSATGATVPDSPPSFDGLPHIPNTPQPFYPPLPPHGILNLALYHNARDSHGQYDVLETEDYRVTGSSSWSTAYEEEEHHRELAFSDRMY